MFNTIGKFDLPKIRPTICSIAAYLGYQLQCRYLIDVGCGNADELSEVSSVFKLVGLGHNSQGYARHVEWDFNRGSHTPIDREILSQAVIICDELLGRLDHPVHLLDSLRSWLDSAPLCVLSVLEENCLGAGRTPVEFERYLRSQGFNVVFTGRAIRNITEVEKKKFVAVVERNQRRDTFANRSVPPAFRVLAIVAVYNEEDIITDSISHLISQGIDVYVLDNWSTDSSFELASQLIGRGVVAVERFPRSGPPRYFDLSAILTRKEEIAKSIEADWFINSDADEIRLSPWNGLNLREAIYRVDKEGYNAIDNTIVVFPPVDNGFIPGASLQTHFKYFEFGQHFSDFMRINAWKNIGQEISIAPSGGHSVSFHNRRVYPYKFLTKHYAIRSQTHGEKKILVERIARYEPEEKARGWHSHYNDVAGNATFLKDPSQLIPYDEERFYEDWLVERLTGIGALSTAGFK